MPSTRIQSRRTRGGHGGASGSRRPRRGGASVGGSRFALLALAIVAALAALAFLSGSLTAVLGPGRTNDGAASRPFQPFGTVDLTPAFELDGAGENVDSIAFWEAPNPAETLMLVTAKDNQLVEVWRYPFLETELQPLRHASFATETQVNGIVIDQATDRLYIAVSDPAPTVTVFSLPDLADVGQFEVGPDVELGDEPNLALLNQPEGTKLLVSSPETVYVLDAASGTPVGEFDPAAGLETIVGDDVDQALYIPDENGKTGVYAHMADGTPFLRGETNVFGSGAFQSDAEGVELYRCLGRDGSDSGRGLIIVSDQVAEMNEFEVFDRQTWEHLGILRLRGVGNTDGIASTQRALPRFPLGLFAAIDDDEATAGIGWERVLGATGITC